MVLIAETESTVREEEHAASIVEPMALPLKVMMRDSLKKISIDGSPTEIYTMLENIEAQMQIR